jgi:hypothetical protein
LILSLRIVNDLLSLFIFQVYFSIFIRKEKNNLTIGCHVPAILKNGLLAAHFMLNEPHWNLDPLPSWLCLPLPTTYVGTGDTNFAIRNYIYLERKYPCFTPRPVVLEGHPSHSMTFKRKKCWECWDIRL